MPQITLKVAARFCISRALANATAVVLYLVLRAVTSAFEAHIKRLCICVGYFRKNDDMAPV